MEGRGTSLISFLLGQARWTAVICNASCTLSCYRTALFVILLFFGLCLYIYIYGWVNSLPSHLIPGGSPPTLSLAANIASSFATLLDPSSSQPDPTSSNGLRVRLPGKDGAHAGDLRFFWRVGSEPEAAAQHALFPALFSSYWISGSIRPSDDWRWCQWFMGMYFLA